MKPEEAIEILRDTPIDIKSTRDDIHTLYATAQMMAIEALKEISLYKNGGLCLVPIGVYEKQCKELDEYKEIGTVEECKTAMDYWKYLREKTLWF